MPGALAAVAGEHRVGGVGVDLGSASAGHGLVAAEQVLDGGGGDQGARPERVEGDPVLAKLLGHAERAEAHPVLGDRVADVHLGPLRIEAERRRERQHVWVVRLLQMRDGVLGEDVGAARVDVLHQVVALHVHVLGAGEVDRARVVDAEINPAELLDRLGHGGSDAFLIADVADDRQRLTTGLLDLSGRGVHRAVQLRMRLGRLRDERDVGAIAGGAERDGQADPAATATDQHRLALEGAFRHGRGRYLLRGPRAGPLAAAAAALLLLAARVRRRRGLGLRLRGRSTGVTVGAAVRRRFLRDLGIERPLELRVLTCLEHVLGLRDQRGRPGGHRRREPPEDDLLAHAPDARGDRVDREARREARDDRHEKQREGHCDAAMARLQGPRGDRARRDLRTDVDEHQRDQDGAVRLQREIGDEEEAAVAEDAVAGIVAEQQIEGDEDRNLQEQRGDGGQRVHPVGLVIGGHLPLELLPVAALVLGLHPLQLRLVKLHLALGAELADDQRQHAAADQHRQPDDRQAPAEAEGVQALEHPLLDVGERLKDVRGRHRPGRLLSVGAEVAMTVVCHHHQILDPDPKLAGYVDARLDRDDVAGEQLVVGALRQPRRLVDLDPDAVSEPVSEELAVPAPRRSRRGRRHRPRGRRLRP